MEVTIVKTVKRKVKINIEFPFYFEYDMSGDSYSCVVYGKIMEDRSSIMITERECYFDGETTYKVETGVRDSSWFENEIIDENTFCSKLSEAFKAINKIKGVKNGN